MDDALLLMEDPKRMLASLEDAELRLKVETQSGGGLSEYLEQTDDWD
jgi:hypothetical protein